MKKMLLSFTTLFLLSNQAYSKTCRVADTMLNNVKSDHMANARIQINLSKRELSEKKFSLVNINNVTEGDFVFRVVKSVTENGREQFGLTNCLLTALTSTATLGAHDWECMVPDDLLEVTTVQLLHVETQFNSDLKYEVIEEFNVETEWNGPNIPRFHKNLSNKSKKVLLPCTYY